MAQDRNTVVLEMLSNDILDLKKRIMALEEANGELRRKIDELETDISNDFDPNSDKGWRPLE